MDKSSKPRALCALRYVGGNALVLVIYFLSAKLGLSLAMLNDSVTAIWPATGVAIAAMLLLGRWVWPAIFIGAFLINSTTTGTIGTSLGIAAGNTLEAVIAGELVRRFAGGRRAFDRAADVVRFVILAALFATAISATIGTTLLTWTDLARWENYGPIWLTWWLGDVSSAVIVTPLLVILLTHRPSRAWAARVPEGLLLLALLVGVGLFVFNGFCPPQLTNYPLGYLGIPLLIWAAFRFGPVGAITTSSLLAAMALRGTLAGYGPFAQESVNASLLLLQAFSGVMTVTSLVLAAVISERAGARQDSAGNEQRLSMALEAGQMGTWQWEIGSGRVVWSPGLERIHGFAPGTFPGTFEAFLEDIHPDDREPIQRQIASTLEHRTDHHIEYRLKLADGTERWVEGRGRIDCGPDGKPQRMMGVCMDVSDRKRAEIERNESLQHADAARAQAEQASRAKDNFLAVLSHELRTPLAPVLLSLSLLDRREDLPPEVRKDLADVKRQVELESRLIDDLLDLTRIERGKLQLRLEACDVHVLLNSAIDICRRDDGIQVTRQLNAQRVQVCGDAARLHQVFWNLLTNAHKFTPAGGRITVRTRNVEPGGPLIIEVHDTGAGIDPSSLPRLFTAFQQGSAPSHRRAQGLGLGLAISRALIEAQGGSIEAASEGIGRGATFTVSLPTMRAPAQRQDSASGDDAPPVEQSLRVLLVEDHEQTHQLMSRLLTAMGHQPQSAQTVQEALALVRTQPFDLVISDLGLPDGSGHQLMQILRQQYAMPGIALSGYGMDEDIRKSHAAGFDRHLTKPVDLAQLQTAIRQVVAKSLACGGHDAADPAAPSAAE